MILSTAGAFAVVAFSRSATSIANMVRREAAFDLKPSYATVMSDAFQLRQFEVIRDGTLVWKVPTYRYELTASLTFDDCSATFDRATSDETEGFL